MSNWNDYMTLWGSFWEKFLEDGRNADAYEDAIHLLCDCREDGGRVFIAGMGGSAANAQHLANDLRKMCGVDAYSLSDNIAELTARANDDGFASIYIESLKVSNFGKNDVLFVLSVSGGDAIKNASIPLVDAMILADQRGGKVIAIVGMEDSFTAKNFNGSRFGSENFAVMITPTVDRFLTQFAEAAQGVIWHGLISDPRLMVNKAKW